MERKVCRLHENKRERNEKGYMHVAVGRTGKKSRERDVDNGTLSNI